MVTKTSKKGGGEKWQKKLNVPIAKGRERCPLIIGFPAACAKVKVLSQLKGKRNNVPNAVELGELRSQNFLVLNAEEKVLLIHN